MKSKNVQRWLSDNTALVGLVIVLIVGSLVNFQSFFALTNFLNVGRQATIRGLLACGMTMVIIAGSIDLSVSTNFALCSYLTLYFGQFSTALGFVMPIFIGAFVGLMNAVMIARWKFPAWVATIAMQLGIQGVLLQLTQGNTFKPAVVNQGLSAFGNFMVGPVSIYLILFVLVYAVFSYLMRNRASFRNIYALGGNLEAAKMMGVSEFKTCLLAHVSCGALTGLAGLLLASRTAAAYPLAGTSYEMYAIAASVLGGIYLTGGRGRMIGTFAGAWILGFLSNIFNMQAAINPLWEQVVTGSVLILVVVIQSINSGTALFAHKKKRAPSSAVRMS